LRFQAVTTFNRAGLDLYGRRMMESYVLGWPPEVPLVAYYEGWRGPDHAPPRVEVRDLLASSPWLAEFKRRHADRISNPAGGYRHDAVRFSHKVAALCHAASVVDADYLIWLDGDIVTHAPISLADLASLAPGRNEWIAWLRRRRMYPECGFYILNLKHPAHAATLDRFERMYREDGLFSLAEWHDSYVLQQVVAAAGVGQKSLSGRFENVGHPLVNGPLGAWLDHLKGARKQTGKSGAADMHTLREEPYWKGTRRP
jgi:hypothetical protein